MWQQWRLNVGDRQRWLHVNRQTAHRWVTAPPPLCVCALFARCKQCTRTQPYQGLFVLIGPPEALSRQAGRPIAGCCLCCLSRTRQIPVLIVCQGHWAEIPMLSDSLSEEDPKTTWVDPSAAGRVVSQCRMDSRHSHTHGRGVQQNRTEPEQLLRRCEGSLGTAMACAAAHMRVCVCAATPDTCERQDTWHNLAPKARHAFAETDTCIFVGRKMLSMHMHMERVLTY